MALAQWNFQCQMRLWMKREMMVVKMEELIVWGT